MASILEFDADFHASRSRRQLESDRTWIGESRKSENIALVFGDRRFCWKPISDQRARRFNDRKCLVGQRRLHQRETREKDSTATKKTRNFEQKSVFLFDDRTSPRENSTFSSLVILCDRRNFPRVELAFLRTIRFERVRSRTNQVETRIDCEQNRFTRRFYLFFGLARKINSLQVRQQISSFCFFMRRTNEINQRVSPNSFGV